MIRKRKMRSGWAYQVIHDTIPTRTFHHKEDAETYQSEELRKQRLGEYHVEPAVKFGVFLDDDIRRKSAGWAYRTWKSRLETRKDLQPLDDLYVNRITRGMVEDLVDAVVARGAPRQAQKALQMVKATLHSAQGRNQKVDQAVFEIKPPSYEPRKVRFLTIDEVKHLASFCSDKDYRIVLLAAYTGMRQSELLDLKTTDLHLDEGFLVVQRGKTKNSARTVYLIKPAVALLREQLLIRKAGTSFVFPALKGGRYDRNDFMTKVFRPARARAGMEDVTFHALRHTFVSLAGKEGLSEDVIGKMTGWSSKTVRSMLERYRHVYDSEVAEAVAAMERIVG